MGKYRHYGSHGYLMARPPLVEKGKVWWEDFTFTPMAKVKGRKHAQEFLTATALLPERLLIPMGGANRLSLGILGAKREGARGRSNMGACAGSQIVRAHVVYSGPGGWQRGGNSVEFSGPC